VFGTILHRMVFLELLKVFVLALTAITSIVVLATVVAEATRQGLGPLQILVIIPLIVPTMLPYIVPPTMLFATCVVYGRLAADNEILAIKAAGGNVLNVVWPALFFGAAAGLITLGLYVHIIPTTFHLMRSAFVSDIEQGLYAILKKDREIKQPGLPYIMFVVRVQGRRLENVHFRRRDPKNPNRYDVIAVAQEAELQYDARRNVLLVPMWNGNVQGDEGKVYFDYRVWEVQLPPLNPGRKLAAREMTWTEVIDRRAETLADVEKKTADMALHTAQLLMQNPPSTTLKLHLDHVQAQVRQANLEILSYNTELRMRPALAFGCFFFVLVGCPVGIWLGRSDYLSAFITCFVPIVLIYYPVLLCGNNLAKGGKLDPTLGTWAANGLMALIAVVLFRKLLRN
jgi:lipopolysaccharide export system permease protein